MPFIYPFMYSPFIYSYASDLIGDHNQYESYQTAFLLFYAFLFISHQTLWLILSYSLSSLHYWYLEGITQLLTEDRAQTTYYT